jgi:DNA-binding NarL/FixJ family response regulator
MTKGTLALSREINLHAHFKMWLETLGFRDVTVSAVDRDALNRLIEELKPRRVLISCDYYQCSTPFMIKRLLKQFPGLNIVAVSIAPYPTRLAMRFINNGAKSCVYLTDGVEQFRKGLECVRDGREFISYSVQKTIRAQYDCPKPAGELTEREIEIARLLCNGYTNKRIAENLHISIRTVTSHKSNMYRKLDVENAKELIRVVLYLGIIKQDELCFYGNGRNWSRLKPKV